MRAWVIVPIVAVLFFCVGAAPASSAVLKLATVAPEGSSWMKEMRHGAADIREKTDGRVRIKFFGGGVMGNEKSVLRKIRVGQLHGGAFTAGGLAQVYPDLNIYSLPMVFRSTDELDFVRRRMDPVLREGLEKAGFVSFGFSEAGFARIMSKTPVRGLEDLKGQKIWIPDGDRINYEVMDKMGLSPVSLPITDVLTGLQTGLIDIIGTSPVGAIAFQWHTRIKYVTDVPLAYLFAMLAIDKRAFDRLQPEDRAVVREVMEDIYRRFNTETREDNREALRVLAEQGITLVETQADEIGELRAEATRIVEELGREGAFDVEMYRHMKTLLDTYRGRTTAGLQQ